MFRCIIAAAAACRGTAAEHRYISTAKSPQQIMGTLVKHRPPGATEQALTPAQIYHVAVMPCLDKKLEASRECPHGIRLV